MPSRRTRRGRYRMSQGFGQPFTLNRHSPQARGLLAWWPTNGSRGTFVLRAKGGTFGSATLYGSAALVQDSERGAALNLTSGTRDYASATGAKGAGSITLCTWIRNDDPSPWALHNYLATAGTFAGIRKSSQDGGLEAVFYIGGGYRAASNINDITPDGEWVHIGATYDGTTIRLYLNGLQVKATAYSGTFGAITGIYIGAQGQAQWDGAIDDPRIYGVAKSPSEMWQMYTDPWDLYATPGLPWARVAAAPTGNPWYFYAQQ